jgi:dihydrolipoamide dehydrogenase
LKHTEIKLDEKGFIRIDSNFQTDAAGIFAIGDLVSGPMLAHKAEEEGVVFAERLAGKNSSIGLFAIPSVIYTFPEVASVGFSDKDPLIKGRELLIGKFPIKALGRAKAMNQHAGLVKVIADEKSRRLLGVHLFCPFASEIILAGALALRHRMTIDQFRECSFAHPSLSEGLKEALSSFF